MEKNSWDGRASLFHQAIASFIETRRDAKLKGKEDDAATAAKYDYATWLADAARRVRQIQAVTHVLKATHPDARGSSLHIKPMQLRQHTEIGSHLLGKDYAEDVVGNAAALDVFKFLKVEVGGKRLLDWILEGNTDLQAALSSDTAQAQEWMQAFASLVRTDEQLTSHPMAKQVYWLVGEEPQDNAQYHLLQPMFSSSLEHAVHNDIQEARFGEINKEARQAFRDKKPSDVPYRDYRNLVARKLGGTKPQNISQLNSERGGVNYLLSSLPPPAWREDGNTNVLKRETIFDVFLHYDDVRKLVNDLSDYLKSVQDETSNKEIKDTRDGIVKEIADRLVMFGSAIRARYTAGWTLAEDCRLPRCEQLWLDPDRIELARADNNTPSQWLADDEAFCVEYDDGRWADELATRFGKWINARLRERDLSLMAGLEMRHWTSQLIIDIAWPAPMRRRT